jgi:cytochrome c biogenesis protein CcmG, thiol:disulfide interchange protein DsbE
MERLLSDTRRWTRIMLVVALFGAAWTFRSRVPATATTGGAPPPSPREGFSAPDFTLDLLAGGQVTLSDLRGKVVLVNLWASWCPPCRAEMPAIEKVYRSYKDLGLEVLGVNTTNQDSQAAAAAFVKEVRVTFPIPLDRTGEVSAAYDLRGLPTSFFIDRKGVIRSVVVGGPMSEALIQSKVEELLREGP